MKKYRFLRSGKTVEAQALEVQIEASRKIASFRRDLNESKSYESLQVRLNAAYMKTRHGTMSAR